MIAIILVPMAWRAQRGTALTLCATFCCCGGLYRCGGLVWVSEQTEPPKSKPLLLNPSFYRFSCGAIFFWLTRTIPLLPLNFISRHMSLYCSCRVNVLPPFLLSLVQSATANILKSNIQIASPEWTKSAQGWQMPAQYLYIYPQYLWICQRCRKPSSLKTPQPPFSSLTVIPPLMVKNVCLPDLLP